MVNARCRQKLDEVNQSKESELAALHQHMSAIEQQLAATNIVSFVHTGLDESARFYML